MVLGFIQNLGPWQLVLCLVVAFVLFGGAKKLPEFARSLGKAKNEFKKGLEEGARESDEEDAKKKSVEEQKKEPAKELA